MKVGTLALWPLCLAGCASAGASSAAAGAAAIPVVAVPIALEAGLYRGATGYGCFAVCPEGARCNAGKHVCEPLPCRGGCPLGQFCDTAASPARCLADVGSLRIWKDREGPAPLAR